MKTKIFIMGLVCLCLTYCATAPAPRTIVNSFAIEEDYDAVWSALIETFAELQLPIDNMEKDSGLITTDWIEFTGQTNEDYCDCGGLGINIEVNRLGKFNVFMKKVTEDSCQMTINCTYEQTIKFGDNVAKRKCMSTGNLEKEMYDLVLARL
jgi:hypothetical protein